MKGYLKDKYCIYLDQFAASNMVDCNPVWNEVRIMIIKGAKSGRFICPTPAEHLIETAGKLNENAIVHHNFLTSLSHGYFFKIEPKIAAQIMISKIRKNNLTGNTFLSNQISKDFSYDATLPAFRKNREELKGMIAEVSDYPTLGARGLSTDLQRTMMETHKLLTLGEFCDRLEELIVTKGGIRLRGVEFATRTVPHWIDLILDILLKINKMTIEESKVLLKYLRTSGFEEISPLDVRTSMTAYSESRGKHGNSNDQIDIMRIATSIQIADILFVDKAKKHELQDLGLAKKYNTAVFSGTKADIENCAQLLDRWLSG